MTTSLLPPAKLGRPPRHPIDILRTRLWFFNVKRISGLPSAYAIELALEPDSVRRNADGAVLRPRKWDAYEKGQRVPQWADKRAYAVELAEQRFPGTAEYFDAPIWNVLRKEKVSLSWVDAQLRQCSEPISDILIRPDLTLAGGVPYFADFDKSSARLLAQVGTFEALGAAVLLVAKSELISSPDLREHALDAYLAMRPVLAQSDDIGPFIGELSHHIDLICKHWVFVTSQARMDVVIFSNEMPCPEPDYPPDNV